MFRDVLAKAEARAGTSCSQPRPTLRCGGRSVARWYPALRFCFTSSWSPGSFLYMHQACYQCTTADAAAAASHAPAAASLSRLPQPLAGGRALAADTRAPHSSSSAEQSSLWMRHSMKHRLPLSGPRAACSASVSSLSVVACAGWLVGCCRAVGSRLALGVLSELFWQASAWECTSNACLGGEQLALAVVHGLDQAAVVPVLDDIVGPANASGAFTPSCKNRGGARGRQRFGKPRCASCAL